MDSSMKRRDFLKKVGIGTAAAVGASTLSAPAVIAQKKYQWKMVTTWPPKMPVLQDACERLAKRIGEHAAAHLQALQTRRSETALSSGQARVIEQRIERVLERLPAAIKQAHERIIGGARWPTPTRS